MKAKELRVNNIVKFIKPVHVQLGHIFDVKNNYVILWSYGIHLIDCDENTNVEPIPLTEEWLLKFGFVKSSEDSDNAWLNLRYRFLNFSSDESVEFKKVFLNVNKMDVVCDYVHQLQNLYFALTGEELTIKL